MSGTWWWAAAVVAWVVLAAFAARLVRQIHADRRREEDQHAADIHEYATIPVVPAPTPPPPSAGGRHHRTDGVHAVEIGHLARHAVGGLTEAERHHWRLLELALRRAMLTPTGDYAEVPR